jgi:hypothetical protein
LLCRDAMARLYGYNPKLPKWWRRIDASARQWLKICAFLMLLAALGASAIRSFPFMALQAGSVLFGAASGYFGRSPAQPVNYITAIMFVVTVGITLQPEYFRFGQLGRLTITHLIALALMAALSASVFVFRNFRPAGFVKDNHYKYIKWFMRLACLLAFILFVMTESVPVLLGFGATVAAAAWFAVKHAETGTNTAVLSGNLWALALALFGIMTVMPAITVAGILCWKNNNVKQFWKSLRGVLK